MFKLKKIGGVLTAVAVTSVLTIGSASATVNVEGITGAIEDVSAVGAAIISVLVAVAAFKYVRRAF